MISRDLFGRDGRITGLRAPAAPIQADLFTMAAETSALNTGRALSQVRIEMLRGLPPVAGSGWRCERDHAMRTHKRRGLYCPICDGAK